MVRPVSGDSSSNGGVQTVGHLKNHTVTHIRGEGGFRVPQGPKVNPRIPAPIVFRGSTTYPSSGHVASNIGIQSLRKR